MNNKDQKIHHFLCLNTYPSGKIRASIENQYTIDKNFDGEVYPIYFKDGKPNFLIHPIEELVEVHFSNDDWSTTYTTNLTPYQMDGLKMVFDNLKIRSQFRKASISPDINEDILNLSHCVQLLANKQLNTKKIDQDLISDINYYLSKLKSI